MEFEAQVDRLTDLVHRSQRIVAFTGAGISTESGIPDFRSPGGVWTRYNPEDFTYPDYLETHERRRKYWQFSREAYNGIRDAQPNAGHVALAALARKGKLRCVITQNIDGLHQMGGMPADRVIEIHGTSRWVGCLQCGSTFPRDEIQARLEAGEEVPDCVKCSGLLKPRSISFGQAMPERETALAFEEARACDLMLSIGSSLVVYPAAAVPQAAKEAGATLVIINMTATQMDHLADLVIRAKSGEVLPPLVERLAAGPRA